ncbi:MAG: hypothetical protein ACM3PY_14265, partial [Omnitrophica WOR_2 bacterium]
MRISYSQTTITPSLSTPVFLAGFQQNRTAISIHDELYCRVLVLEQDSKVLVLAALDLLGLSRIYWNAIERRINDKIPGVRLVGACTHTHHGPDTIGIWGPDFTTTGVNPDYLTWLQEQVMKSVLNALDTQRVPVQLLCGSTHVPGVAKNTRDPEIIDDELAVLQ